MWCFIDIDNIRYWQGNCVVKVFRADGRSRYGNVTIDVDKFVFDGDVDFGGGNSLVVECVNDGYAVASDLCIAVKAVILQASFAG